MVELIWSSLVVTLRFYSKNKQDNPNQEGKAGMVESLGSGEGRALEFLTSTRLITRQKKINMPFFCDKKM
jgi:hypothetical protein